MSNYGRMVVGIGLSALLAGSTGAAKKPAAADEGVVKVGRGEIHYRTTGTGEPLVLLHGFTNAGVVWERFIPRLARQHRVIILDLPGHGRSTPTRDRFTHRGAAEDVLQALEALGVRSFAAVGHSSGGMILLQIAARSPESVRAMVLVAAAPRIPAPAREFARTLSFETVPPPTLAALRKWHLRGDAQIRWLLEQQRAMAADHADMNFDREMLQRIPARTLIVHADRDEAIPLSAAIEMRQAMPNASLLVLPKAGHAFLLTSESATTRIFADAVLEFLDPAQLR